MTPLDLDAIEKYNARSAPARSTVEHLISEVRRLRALPVIDACRTCKWCVGFGTVSRRTRQFVGTWHCEHPDAPKDVGSTERSSWSRPMATDPNAPPPATCPLRGAK